MQIKRIESIGKEDSISEFLEKVKISNEQVHFVIYSNQKDTFVSELLRSKYEGFVAFNKANNTFNYNIFGTEITTIYENGISDMQNILIKFCESNNIELLDN